MLQSIFNNFEVSKENKESIRDYLTNDAEEEVKSPLSSFLII